MSSTFGPNGITFPSNLAPVTAASSECPPAGGGNPKLAAFAGPIQIADWRRVRNDLEVAEGPGYDVVESPTLTPF